MKRRVKHISLSYEEEGASSSTAVEPPHPPSDCPIKTAIVTGANTGIGKETAKTLALQGFRVILACRSSVRGRQAEQDLKYGAPKANVEFMQLDLGSLQSVKHFATSFSLRFSALDVLVNSAGLNTMDGSAAERTEDGFEKCFGVNYLGHFLLTKLLLERLKQSKDGRVVNLSSVMHRFGKTDYAHLARNERADSYSSSKLAMNLFALQLNKQLDEDNIGNVRAFSVNPGAVNSDIWRTLTPASGMLLRPIFSRLFLTSQQGSATSVFAATSTEVHAGAYITPYSMPCGGACTLPFDLMGPFAGPRIATPSTSATDDAAALRLWNLSEELTAPWQAS